MRNHLIVDASFTKFYWDFFLENNRKLPVFMNTGNHEFKGIRTDIDNGNFHFQSASKETPMLRKPTKCFTKSFQSFINLRKSGNEVF